MDNILIGLTGSFGAGSTTTADFLTTKDFKFKKISLSQYLKDNIKKVDPEFLKKEEKERRQLLQDYGDKLRLKNGNSFLVDVVEKEIKKNLETDKVVVDSIKNIEEINKLRNISNKFYLFAIDAKIENRWERLKSNYCDDYSSFVSDDKRDSGEDQPVCGQQVSNCILKADFLINNDDPFFINRHKNININIESFGQKIKSYLYLIDNPGGRPPSIDELSMSYSICLSLKSPCLQRKVGALIINEVFDNKGFLIDFEIISQGFNNPPKEIENCYIKRACQRHLVLDEYENETKFCRNCGKKLKFKKNGEKFCKSHDRKYLKLPSKILDLCRALHAEENAILTAGKYGLPLNSTVLYTTTYPCNDCAKKIIRSQIKKVIYLEPYPVQQAMKALEESGIITQRYEGVNPNSFNKYLS